MTDLADAEGQTAAQSGVVRKAGSANGLGEKLRAHEACQGLEETAPEVDDKDVIRKLVK